MKILVRGLFIGIFLIVFFQQASAQVEELIYDTGSFNGVLANQNPPPGQTVGAFVNFTPMQIPSALQSFKVYLQAIHPIEMKREFTLYIYDNSTNEPIFLDSLITSSSDTGWVEIDLANLNISLTGDFLIGIIHHYDSESPTGMAYPWIGISCLGETCCPNYERSRLLVTPDTTIFENPNFVFFSQPDEGCIGMRSIISYLPLSNPHLNNDASKFYLHQNYPNPFNHYSTIEFTLSRRADVTIHIFSNQGKLIQTLIRKRLTQGKYAIKWHGTDERGLAQPAGIYHYSLIINNRVIDTRKMILIKNMY